MSCCVGFKGGEAIAEVGSGAVKRCAGKVTHRRDGGAECPADLALEGVELESEMLADVESSNDTDSARLCGREGGRGIDAECGRAF
jgi:hypothetical protein